MKSATKKQWSNDLILHRSCSVPNPIISPLYLSVHVEGIVDQILENDALRNLAQTRNVILQKSISIIFRQSLHFLRFGYEKRSVLAVSPFEELFYYFSTGTHKFHNFRRNFIKFKNIF